MVKYCSASQEKSVSSVGRVLIWRLAVFIAGDNWPHGLGFGNYSSICNLYEGRYFVREETMVPLRMAADQIAHSSEPLEMLAEYGVWGLVMIIVITLVIIREITILIRNYVSKSFSEFGNSNIMECHTNIITIGMACSVLAFVLLSLVHFPRKIMPTFAIFNIATACVVKTNWIEENRMLKYDISQKDLKVWVHWCLTGFLVLLFIIICAMAPIYIRNYCAVRQWYRGVALAQTGEFVCAQKLCEKIEGDLKWNGKFSSFYGNILIDIATKTNIQSKYSNIKQAIALYERGKYTHPNPYMMENLAFAYLQLASGTNWPAIVQTRYKMETPAQMLLRKFYEWRLGGQTNLFQQYPSSKLSRSKCINRAVKYLTLASNILPWRLTSKRFLAQTYYNMGNESNAIKYARLVVNTPMKKWTKRGKEFKLKSQKMLVAMGEKCDDPGLIVFDINDKKTWNEGSW